MSTRPQIFVGPIAALQAQFKACDTALLVPTISAMYEIYDEFDEDELAPVAAEIEAAISSGSMAGLSLLSDISLIALMVLGDARFTPPTPISDWKIGAYEQLDGDIDEERYPALSSAFDDLLGRCEFFDGESGNSGFGELGFAFAHEVVPAATEFRMAIKALIEAEPDASEFITDLLGWFEQAVEGQVGIVALIDTPEVIEELEEGY